MNPNAIKSICHLIHRKANIVIALSLFILTLVTVQSMHISYNTAGSGIQRMKQPGKRISKAGIDKEGIPLEKPMILASTMHCFLLGYTPMEDLDLGQAVEKNSELVDDWKYWPPTDQTLRAWFSSRIVGKLNSGAVGMKVELDNANEAGIDALGVLISGNHLPNSKFARSYKLLAEAATNNSVKIFPDLWIFDNPSDKYSYAKKYGMSVKALMDEYPDAFLKVDGKFVVGLGSPLNYGIKLREKKGMWYWKEFKPFFDAWGGTDSLYLLLNMFHYVPEDIDQSGWGEVFNALTVWGARLGWGDLNVDTVIDYVQERYAKPIMWPLNSSYYTSGHQGLTMAETLGMSRFIDQWRKARSKGANHLMVQTWNDFSEDHSISESNLRGKTIMEILKYLSYWFKHDSPAYLDHESIFLFHHPQLVNAAITEGTRRGSDPDWHMTPMSDYLHTVTILKEPAILKLELAEQTWTSNIIPAGLHEWLVYVPSLRKSLGLKRLAYVRTGSYPSTDRDRDVTIAKQFHSGTPELSVIRDGYTVFRLKSHVPIEDRVRFENLAMAGSMAKNYPNQKTELMKDSS
jgi:hypothetical protein